MIFIDTWAWVALADESDQYHELAKRQHRKLLKRLRRYVTSNDVLTEVINYLYSALSPRRAEASVEALWTQFDRGTVMLAHVSSAQFRGAWQLRRKYADKPDISFTDFTSMVVMQDLGISEVFTGDAHFRQVGLGFTLLP